MQWDKAGSWTRVVLSRLRTIRRLGLLLAVGGVVREIRLYRGGSSKRQRVDAEETFREGVVEEMEVTREPRAIEGSAQYQNVRLLVKQMKHSQQSYQGAIPISGIEPKTDFVMAKNLTRDAKGGGW